MSKVLPSLSPASKVKVLDNNRSYHETFSQSSTKPKSAKSRGSPSAQITDTSFPSVQKIKDEPPVTIDFEYRIATVTTSHVLIDIKQFKATYKLDPKVDLTKIHLTADKILEELGVYRIVVQDRTELLKIFSSKKHEAALKKYRPESTCIELLAKQSRHFDAMAENLVNRLRYIFDTRLRRYCVSYIDEPNTSELSVILDYQDYILQTSGMINSILKQMEQELKEYRELKELFLSDYLENLPKALSLIDSVCNNGVHTCNIMKQWVQKDKNYSKKLWECIINANLKRGKLLEELKKLQRKKSEIASQIARKQHKQTKVKETLEEKHNGGHCLHENRTILATKLEKIIKEIEEKETEYETVNEAIFNRKTNSPKYLEALNLKCDELKERLDYLNEKKASIERKVNKLEITGKHIDSEVKVLQRETASGHGSISSLQTKSVLLDEELKAIGEKLSSLESKVVTARHIRGLKVSSAQLRKLFYQGISKP